MRTQSSDGRNATDRSCVATIVYTSGTTGRPKGCVLTHGNFKDLTDNTIEAFGEAILGEGASTAVPDPGVRVRPVHPGAVRRVAGHMAHSHDIKLLMDDFAALQPTFFLAVPRVFEKIYNAWGAARRRRRQGQDLRVRRRHGHRLQPGAGVRQGGDGAQGQAHGVRHLVYGKLRAAMGGKVTYAVSGGAPLGTRLGHFFKGIGVTVLEGYGLTETTAPATVNTPSLIKVGTVGYPLPGVGIRIAEDGEIMIAGNNVFRGYHGNEQATSEAIEDGWFHTGDIGELDSDGYLKITGRKKELLVTAGGKNVAPAVLEDRLRAHALVSQCIVVGDQKPFIAALVTLDEEMVPTWAKINGYDGLTFEQARTHEAVVAEVQKAVDYANEAVSHAEAVKKFQIIPGDFTEENGYLTPSLKLKRNVVMKDYADDVEALYSRRPGCPVGPSATSRCQPVSRAQSAVTSWRSPDPKRCVARASSKPISESASQLAQGRQPVLGERLLRRAQHADERGVQRDGRVVVGGV